MVALIGRTFSNDPVLSTLADEKPFVSTGKVPDKELGISAALGGMDLDSSDHSDGPPTLM